jgi:hypothetical protein
MTRTHALPEKSALAEYAGPEFQYPVTTAMYALMIYAILPKDVCMYSTKHRAMTRMYAQKAIFASRENACQAANIKIAGTTTFAPMTHAIL